MIMGVSVWLVFERSGYTILSLSSSVLLLLITILFVWSKAASLLNRPAPPLPDLYLTEEMVAEAGEFARTQLNSLVSTCRNVALGKDSRLFVRVVACLLLIFAVGSLTDFVSLCYICLVLLLTIPVLYEKYEDQIDKKAIFVYRTVQQMCLKIEEYISMLRKLDLEKIQ
ncbi:reticulon-like protein B12 isoform X2 [Silene latifolia]